MIGADRPTRSKPGAISGNSGTAGFKRSCGRRELISGNMSDPAVTRWYHRVTRCMRPTFLLMAGPENPNVRVEDRLEELA